MKHRIATYGTIAGATLLLLFLFPAPSMFYYQVNYIPKALCALGYRAESRCLFTVTDPESAILAPPLSMIIVAACLFILLSRRFGPKDRPWAYGILGAVIGYWLRF